MYDFGVVFQQGGTAQYSGRTQLSAFGSRGFGLQLFVVGHGLVILLTVEQNFAVHQQSFFRVRIVGIFQQLLGMFEYGIVVLLLLAMTQR